MTAAIPAPHTQYGSWGPAVQAWLNVGHLAPSNTPAGQHRAARIVTEYGDKTSAGIQAAIDASEPGDAILFPGGTYALEGLVASDGKKYGFTLLPDRAYIAQGAVTLRQNDDTELDALVAINPDAGFPRRNLLWVGIELDGNAVDANARMETNNTMYLGGSGYAKNNGMVLDSLQFSNFFGIQIRHCGGTGLIITGSDPWDFSKQGSTNHWISPYIYGCGHYGVQFGPTADDNHLYDADVGACQFEAAVFLGGSSSLRNCTLWGSWVSSGVTVGATSNQIIGCQVEGHAQHGVVLTEYGNFTSVIGNKIYYNSIETPGSYDSIYVEGSALQPVRNGFISGNKCYSGIDDFFLDPTTHAVDPGLFVAQRRAISLDTYHANFVVEGNDLEQTGPGAEPDPTRLPIYGLTSGDIYNGTRILDSTEEAARAGASPVAFPPGESWWRDDIGQRKFHTGPSRARVERFLSSEYDMDYGSFTASGTSHNVTGFSTRFDSNYTVLVEPSWDTRWWITDRYTDQFTVHFSDASDGSEVRWVLFRTG